MNIYRFTINTLSAFGTPLVGDSLFGQLCWAIVNQFGESRLTDLLQGYTEQQPFLVVSDAFPHNHLPLPTLPSDYWEQGNIDDRKLLKKKQWISLDDYTQPTEKWQIFANVEKEVIERTIKNQPHNTIDRHSGTTGEEQFTPYAISQIWYAPNTLLDLYIVLDETRLSLDELSTVLNNISKLGFGRDASIGLGRFELVKNGIFTPRFTQNSNAYLTLANCAPQSLGLDKSRCFYQLNTRFGRHGDIKALQDNPFKKPIILAKPAAVFTPHQWQTRLFLGNGLSSVSYAQNEAVHQGYAPVIPLALKFDRLGEQNE